MTVDDVNLALGLKREEPLYGLGASSTCWKNLSDKSHGFTDPTGPKVEINDFAKLPLPKCPILPEISLHWLAVHGVQPNLPENPVLIVPDDQLPATLPKALQSFYARITSTIISLDQRAMPAVYEALLNDAGLQELLPFISRFIYQQIKGNTKSLPLTIILSKCLRCLIENRFLCLDFHLQQLLPAIFTCIVANKLSSSPFEDHWALRELSAATIARICVKYCQQFPDLQSRVCKTYLEALGSDKSLNTVFGAIVGMSALGVVVVNSLLVPRLSELTARLENPSENPSVLDTLRFSPILSSQIAEECGFNVTSQVTTASTKATGGNVKEKDKGKSVGAHTSTKSNKLQSQMNDAEISVDRCRRALLKALGQVMVQTMKLPSLPPSALPHANGKKRKLNSPALFEGGGHEKEVQSVCGLEESLVPYYCAASTMHHCLLMI